MAGADANDADGRRRDHRRAIVYDSFARPDGLWDVEAELVDSKSYDYHDRNRGVVAAGEPFHRMGARVTVDAEMTVHAVETWMDATPFAFCAGGAEGAQALVGANLMREWRRTLNAHLGATHGCTHLKELLGGLPTVAMQAVSAWRDEDAYRAGERDDEALTEAPFFLGACHSWALDGPAVARFFPQFHTPPADGEAPGSGER